MSAAKCVCIIGAGPSGLASIKSCLEEGLECVCYELSDDIGGIWNAKNPTSNASVYSSCTMISSKQMSCFSDFPVPDGAPNFMHNRWVLLYLRLYAEQFQLTRRVTFGAKVLSVEPESPTDANTRWVVEVSLRRRNADGAIEHMQLRRTFDAVLVCSGHHWQASCPSLAGISSFHGDVCHSSGYVDHRRFVNKRVLLVGLGNSGADLACELSWHCRSVTLSCRAGGAWIVGKTGPFGWPMDALATTRLARRLLPDWALEAAVRAFANFKHCHRRLGIKPEHGVLSAHPTIHDQLQYRIADGFVTMKPGVAHFAADGRAMFADGSSALVDAVIFATGYRPKLPFLSPELLKVEEDGWTSLYKFTFHRTYNSFAVVGLLQVIGAFFPVLEAQARWAAKVFAAPSAEHLLPTTENRDAEITERRRSIKSRFRRTDRHSMETHWLDIMDTLADEIGCRPGLAPLLLQHRSLGLLIRCWCQPCLPAQYRLVGRHAWPEAVHFINNGWLCGRRRINGANNATTNAATVESSLAGFWILLAVGGLILAMSLLLNLL